MKALIIVSMIFGSILGSYIPALWGGSVLSISSIIFGAVGAIAGIWIGYKLAQRFGFE